MVKRNELGTHALDTCFAFCPKRLTPLQPHAWPAGRPLLDLPLKMTDGNFQRAEQRLRFVCNTTGLPPVKWRNYCAPVSRPSPLDTGHLPLVTGLSLPITP